jgi:hypothetical protein
LGAFSTLLYVRICEAEESVPGVFGGHRLAAFAVGDSCLFQLRGGELVRSFPLDKSEQFEADPLVLGSVDLKRDHLLEFAILDEMCYPGDELILCTDAVADWAMRVYESGEPPGWGDFWQMSDDDWRSGVAWLRQERQMRIDDATMLMLRLVEQHATAPGGDGRPPEMARPTSGGEPAGSPAGGGWLRTAGKDLKAAGEQVAEHVEQASEWMRTWTSNTWKKCRDALGGKRKPPEE